MKKLFNDFRYITFLYLMSILAASLLYSELESKTFLEGVWWSFITSLTIGYGDQFPITVGGRLMGICFSLFWVFVIIPAVISRMLNVMLEDQQAYTHDEQEWTEQSLKIIAEKLGVTLPTPPKDW